MYIARILYPVEVLGPGKRIGIWFCGCPRRCEGCSNPELCEFQERYQVSQERVMQMIHKIADHYPVDGFTLTGGDPLFQFDACMKLIQKLKTISPDILLYTGYTFDELAGKDLIGISVLIDGPYLQEQNNGCFLRGSDNQNILILEEQLKAKYTNYLENGQNQIQNFTVGDTVVSVGIHKKEFSF